METVNVTVIHPDGNRVQTTIPKRKGQLEAISKFVGGYVEMVRLPDGQTMLVNEDGLIVEPKLNLNPEANRLAGQPIVGSVVVMRNQDFY